MILVVVDDDDCCAPDRAGLLLVAVAALVAVVGRHDHEAFLVWAPSYNACGCCCPTVILWL